MPSHTTEFNMRPMPGSPELQRNAEGDLTLDGHVLGPLAATHGTPLYVYSGAAIARAIGQYTRAFAGRNAKVHYAMKANSTLGVLKLVHELGCGFDIVSGGELQRALFVGAKGSDIIFSGVGKTRGEMRLALAANIACFNVESESELCVLNEEALALGRRAKVSVRVNPNVDPKTHPYISTGLKGNKFGIAHERVLGVYRRAASLPGLEVVGIDCHIGSQITQPAPYLEAMDRMLDLVDDVEAAGIALTHIDFGGGLGIDYNGDTPPDASALWQPLLATIDARGHSQKMILIEPGRSIVGNAGVCVTEVLYLKPGEQKNFCIVDAAMNDLPRPAMYQAFHDIVPLLAPQPSDVQCFDVVGPVCESGDWIGRDRELSVKPGDLLAVLSAGAYCSAMASNYNTRSRGAEVLLSKGGARVIRKRETFTDLVANELDSL